MIRRMAERDGEDCFTGHLSIGDQVVARFTARHATRRQYFSGTKLRPFNVAWSSYSPLSDLPGSLTFSRGTSPYGMRLSRCAMQFSRARRLSSDRTTYHGQVSVSVA